ncbi:MAG: GNAT family N-acetyltransferase [Oscillospiraceae bacterium]|nr:GNAT family N-acetyltransferase [Oscillospiraceae bacterium]
MTGSLIEDLYVLPGRQNKGYGTRLLRFAPEKCAGRPAL